MKTTRKITGTLRQIGRLAQSPNGNPRYLVSIDGTECRTAPDSAMSYEVPQLDGHRVIATVRQYRGYLTLEDADRRLNPDD